MKQLVVMDFSRVYEEEHFYKIIKEQRNKKPLLPVKWMDFTNILETNGYCSEEAARRIEQKIENESPAGLHFIDSGNYHYMSLFWIKKIEEDFRLVVFDHHSDMEKPLFGQMLTCGDWILKAINTLEHLKEVIFVGVDETYEKEILSLSKTKVCIVHNKEELSKMVKEKGELPVYLSIDKDVLSEQVVETNWDQGNMSLTVLKRILKYLLLNQRVIGMDVCGECQDVVENMYQIDKNDWINEKICEWYCEVSK